MLFQTVYNKFLNQDFSLETLKKLIYSANFAKDTFKTYPNSEATEDIKINFRSRLRDGDGARNWYLAT